MELKIPIYIPTRGGKSKQITYDNVPDEHKSNVIMFVGEQANVSAPQIVCSNEGIARKRQMILEHARDNHYEYFVMIDDDCRFKPFEIRDVGGKFEYKIAKGKATANTFNDFFSRSLEMFEQYKNLSLISDHNSAFVYTNKNNEWSMGLSKFVLHNTARITSRYDRVNIFEDIDFYLQETSCGKSFMKLKRLSVSNKTSDYKDMDNDKYVKFFDEWKKSYGPYVDILEVPSIFAGDKKIPVTVTLKYLSPAGNQLFDLTNQTS